MRIKLDCPVDFVSIGELNQLFYKHDCTLGNLDADCVIVNPGTSRYLGPEYFNQFPFLKVVGTPSTGVNHLDIDYLKEKGIKSYSLLDDRDSLDGITASAEFTWLHIMNAVRKFSTSLKFVSNARTGV